MEAAPTPIRLLLVENEFLAGRLLSVLVRGLGYEPVGPVATADEALELFRTAGPPVDVALLDVGLDGDRDGIELAHELYDLRPVPVIFLTSMADEATFGRAKQARPAAFLLKPYDAAALQYALELALLNFAAQKAAPLPAALGALPMLTAAAAPAAPPTWDDDVLLRDCFFVRERGRLLKVCLADIHYLEVDDKYVALVTASGRYLVRQALRDLAHELDARQFVQIQRGYMINTAFIEGFDEGQTIVMVAGTALPLGRSYRDALLSRLRLVG